LPITIGLLTVTSAGEFEAKIVPLKSIAE